MIYVFIIQIIWISMFHFNSNSSFSTQILFSVVVCNNECWQTSIHLKTFIFQQTMLDKNTKNFSESFKKLLWLEDLLKSCFLNVQFKMQIVVQLFFHLGESRMLNVLSWSASMELLPIKMQQNALCLCCLWLLWIWMFWF